jgi:DNA-binding CsgD family transcriptional regulator
LGEVTEAVVEGYITRQTRQAETRQIRQPEKRQTIQTRQEEAETVGDVAIPELPSEGEVEGAMVETKQTRQTETKQTRQERQPETIQKEEVVRSDKSTTGLQSEDAAEEDMTEKRQTIQTIQTIQPETRQTIQLEERQKRQDVRLSPEQQKIADLVGRGVNTVKKIAKELDMGEAATRTQIKRMIEKGCLEVVSSERPKKYGLKE